MCQKVSESHSPMQISSRRSLLQSRRSAHTQRCSNQTVAQNLQALIKLKVIWIIRDSSLINLLLKMAKKIKLKMELQMFELKSKV